MNAEPTEPKVVIYGGTGFFGRRVADDLIAHADCRILLAARREPRRPPIDPRIGFVRSDAALASSVRRTLEGAFAVVHCAGPYRGQEPILARAAIACGVHYADLAEDADFIRSVRALDGEARRAGVALLSGLSVVPALAALLAQAVADPGKRILRARTFVAPGSRGSRGEATVETLMRGIGTPLRVWREGRQTRVRGWSEKETIVFPPPVGLRTQYLAIETVGSDPMAEELGAESVEFKAGSEFASVNALLAAVSRLRARYGFPRLENHGAVLRRGLRALGAFGTDRGAVIVHVEQGDGHPSGARESRAIAVVADRDGERIPALPAGIVLAALLAGELTISGAVALSRCLPTHRLFDELLRRDLRLWWRCANTTSWVPVERSPSAVS